MHPDPNSPPYRATELRHPKQPLIIIPQTLTEFTAPVYGTTRIGPTDHDLTVQHAAPPLGQRIIVTGRVLDEDDRPVPNTLIEVWQANAAGRYRQKVDRWDAPLDANFTGAGRALTDEEGGTTSLRFAQGHIRGAITTTPGGPRTSIFPCLAGPSRRGW